MKAQDLQKVKLPLSQTDYEKLRKAKWSGQVKWKDFPIELIHAYNAYGCEEREEEWERIKEADCD